jgi:lipopolysaccharide biosynthesis protein
MNNLIRLKFRLRGLLHYLLAKCHRAAWRFNCFVKGIHVAPPSRDYALQIPFTRSAGSVNPDLSVAVICHMFYVDLASEFLDYLSNIPFEFDLFVTTDTPAKKLEIERVFSGRHNLEIRIALNCGRDIAPKLIACADVYARYEFFLHVHSKKSPHGSYLEGWREYLLTTLLGSPAVVLNVFDVFRADPSVGIIAPQHLEVLRPGIGWGLNFGLAKSFGNKLGMSINKSDPLDFPSGSMFWGRSAALKPLLDATLAYSDFPSELGQTDGTTGHVIERLYFLVCAAAGYKFLKVVNSNLLHLASSRVVTVSLQRDLKACLAICATDRR